MDSGTWTRYMLQRRIFAIGEDFWIENDQGQSVFKVDGKALSLRHRFVLQDGNGAELLAVESKLLSLQPTMKIERLGQPYATVTKALFTLLHQHFTIQLETGPSLEASGDITNHEYQVTEGANVVAQISRQWFSIRDAYGVAVAPGQDVPLLLAAAVCIDEITERERERNR